MKQIPDFAWGVSTSPYQNEDLGLSQKDRGFFQTDWDLFFEMGRLSQPKGDGAFAFSRPDRHLEALGFLGVTHYRFGIEWARVEPEPGVFQEDAIGQYVDLARRLREAGIIPVVALWHFTFPSWLTDFENPEDHGWLHPRFKKRWIAYVRKVVAALSPYVDWFAPQNEPNTQAMMGYFATQWPPGTRRSPFLYYQSMDASAEAFRLAAAIVRDTAPQAKIVTIQNMVHWTRSKIDPFGYLYQVAREFNTFHLDRVADITDYIGFTYYMGNIASPFSIRLSKKKGADALLTSDLGWPIVPDGLYSLAKEVYHRYRKPLVIMENGVADRSDHLRPTFLKNHLKALKRAAREGCDIRGYFHWTLVDNFEWAYGYTARFGLFENTPEDQPLAPKESAKIFKEKINSGWNTSPSRVEI